MEFIYILNNIIYAKIPRPIWHNTYRTGQKYFYDYKEQIVKENELLVAIKNKGAQNEIRQ